MLIRSEAPADIMPIDNLLKSVFDTEAEAELVMRLREMATAPYHWWHAMTMASWLATYFLAL